MIKKNTQLIKDILYVSKITKTNRKKLIIISAVILAQLIAFSDIAIILFFTKFFTSSSVLPSVLNFFEFFFEIKILLPTMIVIRYSFSYLQSMLLKRLEFNVQNNMKNYLLSEIFDNRNFSTSDTLMYVNTLAVHISYFYTNISSLLNYSLQSIAFTTFLFITEPRTISAFFVGILFLIYPIYYLIKKSRVYEHKIWIEGKKANSEVQRVLENVFLIKLLKKEEEEKKRYADSISHMYDYLLSKHKIQVLNGYLAPFTTIFLISIIVIFFNSFFNVTLAFIGVTLRMFQSLANVSSATNNIANAQVHLETFNQLENSKLESYKENYIIKPKSQSKKVFEVNDITFKYVNSDSNLFEHLSFEIKKESHTVFTGSNGSGKSTLLGLLAGVYLPSDGKIYSRAGKLGFVGPKPLVFQSSLKENILYGNNLAIDDKNIIEILDQFQLFEGKENHKLDKLIAPSSLSSGQLQKIAFIRVILSDINTLLLDESTANLDETTKNLIFDYLENQNYTIVNATHDIDRFSNVTSHYKVKISEKGLRGLIKII